MFEGLKFISCLGLAQAPAGGATATLFDVVHLDEERVQGVVDRIEDCENVSVRHRAVPQDFLGPVLREPPDDHQVVVDWIVNIPVRLDVNEDDLKKSPPKNCLNIDYIIMASQVRSVGSIKYGADQDSEIDLVDVPRPR